MKTQPTRADLGDHELTAVLEKSGATLMCAATDLRQGRITRKKALHKLQIALALLQGNPPGNHPPIAA